MQARLELFSAEHPDVRPETAEFLTLLREQTERLTQMTRTLPVSYTHLDVYKRQLLTSVRRMPWLRSSSSTTAGSSMGVVKAGQPQPLSYLSVEEKSGSPVTTST